jgi:hypothetical protein
VTRKKGGREEHFLLIFQLKLSKSKAENLNFCLSTN